MTERDILDVLKNRHPAPAWAFFTHFRNQTGYQYRLRTADAIAMSLFPSRGLDIWGYEVKVNRNDWLRELKTPDKAEETLGDVDYIAIVTPPDIVEKGEVPPRWGHAVVKDGKLRFAKSAVRLTKEGSNYVPRDFVASILRRAHEARDAAPGQVALMEQFKRGEAKAKEDAKATIESAIAHYRQEVQTMKYHLDEFEKASGLKINNWDAGQLGEAVHTLLRTKVDFVALIHGMDRMLGESKHLTSCIELLMSMYNRLQKVETPVKESRDGTSGAEGEGVGVGDPEARGRKTE